MNARNCCRAARSAAIKRAAKQKSLAVLRQGGGSRYASAAAPTRSRGFTAPAGGFTARCSGRAAAVATLRRLLALVAARPSASLRGYNIRDRCSRRCAALARARCCRCRCVRLPLCLRGARCCRLFRLRCWPLAACLRCCRCRCVCLPLCLRGPLAVAFALHRLCAATYRVGLL